MFFQDAFYIKHSLCYKICLIYESRAFHCVFVYFLSIWMFCFEKNENIDIICGS